MTSIQSADQQQISGIVSSSSTTVSDRLSYSQSTKAVVVNLDLGITFVPKYDGTIEVMPLGDSITEGVDGVTPQAERGGYRTELWNKFQKLGLNVDFVGSRSSGPNTLGDKDHQGHPGWEIINGFHGSISNYIDQWLAEQKPDVVLLMIGTNDTYNKSGSEVASRLSGLLDKIAANPSFDGEVLVASIPPKKYPQTAQRIKNGIDYNNLIPGVVDAKKAAGQAVTFVDMRSGLTTDDLAPAPPDNGLHPNAGGYDKIANFWYDAFLQAAGEKETFIGKNHVTGSGFDDAIAGNAAANSLKGEAGNDQLSGAGGNDNLQGGDGNDTLDGGEGNDILNGNAGDDSMNGGIGNDTYYVESVGDKVIEAVDGGSDRVMASISYTLGSEVEHLSLSGNASINGTGNAANNNIRGNGGDNFLIGLGGNDNLYGAAGNDTLDGGDGNDILNGFVGDDSMKGGAGNDTYYVESVGDKVIEAGDEGSDRVMASIDYTLGSDVENLSLSGNASINGTGNAANNNIRGNGGDNFLIGLGGNDNLYGAAGNDTLDGGDGNDILNGFVGDDSMKGGAGNDIYYVDSVADKVIEAGDGGSDRVISFLSYNLAPELEELTLIGTDSINGTGNTSNNKIWGNSANNELIGNAGNDNLYGNQGDDTLNGGAGNDVLTGNSGNDRFVSSTGSTFTTNDVGIDRITDFTPNSDQILLSQNTFNAIASSIGNGFSVAGEFLTVDSDALAAISDALIVYNSANGKLFYNENDTEAGFGSGGHFITFANKPTLTATDFQILA